MRFDRAFIRAAGLAVAALLATPVFAEIQEGDAAPDFTLQDQAGEDVKLSSFQGSKHVLLAFYPRAFSGG